MLVLLKRDEADKDTLHYVIETQRALRRSRLNNSETTDPKMVDVVICKLRKKLKPLGINIKTLWGRGYYLNEESRKVAESILTGIVREGYEEATDITTA
jgi:DNA-binding winged helix-turn-helix (wHTH) protein